MARSNVHTATGQTARTSPGNGGRVPGSGLRQDELERRYRAVVRAARLVIQCGHANLNQPKYGVRVRAFDFLDNALDALDELT